MENNWIITSSISSIIGFIITYVLTGDWRISIISAILVFILVILNNPKRRYMRAFYIVLFPLLSNLYFTINSKTENFDIEAGLKEQDTIAHVVLGLICIICLILDYLERNGKLEGSIFSINKNSNKNISGTNININQKINEKDPSENA